jgi:succinyl-diaminopimelate desuccinylase
MNTTKLINQTKRLIAIPSTSDNAAALKQAVDFLAAQIAAVPDVTIERFEQNGKPSFLAYRGAKRPKKFEILLNAHVDVVPGRMEQFQPYEKDGKLYGRGALDMKGTAVVLTQVFCELVNQVPYELALQIVSDEEIGGLDGAAKQIAGGVRSNFVVIGEYSNTRNTVYYAARGIRWVEIGFTGKAAHSGHLWHGKNAVMKASEFAAEVLRRFPTPERETWITTASIAHLSTTNDAYNRVPDQASLKIDFRYTQDAAELFQDEASVEALVHSIDPEAEVISYNPEAYGAVTYTDPQHPYIQGLCDALHTETGVEPALQTRPAGSDGRWFAGVGSHVVEFGLNGFGGHGDDEYVELDSFQEYYNAMRAFLQAPARLPSPTGPAARTLASVDLGSKLV